ncbi:hypothetical protein Acr_07g0010490, partial [Actinidia rufa]
MILLPKGWYSTHQLGGSFGETSDLPACDSAST